MKAFPLSTALLVFLSISLSAGPWAQWRGPLSTGSAPTENPPTSFSPSSDVLWSVPMPGPGSATPAIYNNHLLYIRTDTRLFAIGHPAAKP
jgi:hypothetical protein